MRHPLARASLLLVMAGLFIALLALGTWQVQRRQWKLDLIERTTQRVHATPQDAPTDAALWPGMNAADYAYRHVRVSGVWLTGQDSWVQAVTERGPGFWLLVPLRTTSHSADGDAIVLVNQGFVSADLRSKLEAQAPTQASTQAVTVTGLLRMSEPGGAFLRHNDAQAGRWYSRDIGAIAAAHQLHPIAPFFIDADAAPSTASADAAQAPAGGLTVIAFNNNHLVYAITWYTLALMVAWGGWRIAREP